ncbi:MAG: T9SS type A sorting domain-containing protein [Bacteroidota bacterium]|jgi:hypothetical protein|nr:T9SS type A sorting domain-containing protein [Sphingobacteriales bacterium]
MSKKLFLLLIGACLGCLYLQAQQAKAPVNGWRVHLSFRVNNDLAEAGELIYVASKSALFTLNKNTGEAQVVSKINGLSDVETGCVDYDASTGCVIIGYTNSNIDLLSDGFTYNIPDIKDKIIIGDKNINNITIHNKRAYLACGFGIAVIDLEKKKLADTYTNLGANGASIAILDVAVYENNIYASTKNGIYRAALNNSNLSDFNNWSLFKTSQYSNHMEAFGGQLYAVIDSAVYTYDGISWSLQPLNNMAKAKINDMKVCNNQLIVVTENQIIMLKAGDLIPNVRPEVKTTAAIVSKEGDLYFIALDYSLIKIDGRSGDADYFGPAGPYANTAQRITYFDKQLWVAAGQVDGFGNGAGWSPRSNNDKFYRFSENTWTSFKQSTAAQIINSRDFIDVAINPENKKVYMASFGNGLLELDENGNVLTLFDSSNSSIQNFNAVGYRPTFVSGVAFDAKGNLWVSNFGAVRPISVKTKEGNWYSFQFPANVDTRLGYILCDDYNNKWSFNTKGGGLLVFNDNGTPANSNDDNYKLLTSAQQNGALPSNTVLSMAQDLKGEVWVGTDKGFCIFRNPQDIFKPNKDFDATRIVVKTGLVFSNMLGDNPITCIRVDAANRKWIGTANGGVFLLSEDGYTILRNFNTSNSPLLSDAIYEIGIDGQTGEVFIATDRGIISYMGDATDAGNTHGDVMVYPNPVRPEYTGNIAIKGLVKDANVKITDVAGNLVFETKANGGMATWSGLNFKGKRAATGVYLIYSSNADGTETFVTKILFVN